MQYAGNNAISASVGPHGSKSDPLALIEKNANRINKPRLNISFTFGEADPERRYLGRHLLPAKRLHYPEIAILTHYSPAIPQQVGKPGLDGGPGAAGLTSQHRLTTGGRLEKHHTKTFGVSVDIAIGHGEHVAGIVPARQVLGAHVAEQMHSIRHTHFFRELGQIGLVLTDTDQDIAQRRSLLDDMRQASDHHVKSLAA